MNNRKKKEKKNILRLVLKTKLNTSLTFTKFILHTAAIHVYFAYFMRERRLCILSIFYIQKINNNCIFRRRLSFCVHIYLYTCPGTTNSQRKIDV